MRNKILIFLIFFIISLFLVSMQANYLFGGDSAEYSTVFATFSIPHAPGYPLYSFIGNIITRIIPLGSITWRAGLLSTIPTIITSLFIYLILYQLTKNKNISIFSSVFYIFLYPIWLYAEVPEVFALNNLFIVLITYFILRYNDHQEKKLKYLIYLFIGFSIAHHHTFILFIPGWFFLLKTNLRKKFFLSDWLKNVIFLLVGSSFYFYTILASFFNPPIDWENSKTLSGLIRLIFRTSYGTFNAYAGGSPDFKNQLYDFFSVFVFILQDYRILGTLIILIGIISMFKKPSVFSKFLLISLFVQLFFIFYTNFYLGSSLIIATFERYIISLYLILIFYFGFGLNAIEYILKKYLFKIIRSNLLQKLLTLSYCLFLLIFLTILLLSNYSIIKNVKNTKEFEYYSQDLLSTVPKNSILYVSGDISYFTTQYTYSVNKIRPDIKLIFANLLTRDYYADRTKIKYPDVYVPTNKVSESIFFNEFLEKNSSKFLIFYEHPSPYGGYWQPYGLLWKYYESPEKAKKDSKNLININDRLWSKYNIPKFSKNQKSILFLSHLSDTYRQSLTGYITFLLINEEFNKINEYLVKYIYLLDYGYIEDIKAEIALKKSDCKSLRNYVNTKQNQSLYEMSYNQVKFVIKYYGLCDKNNTEVYKYLDLYKKFNE